MILHFKRPSSDTATITPHSQLEVSPSGEVFLGSNESNNMHSESSTPHRVSAQPQHSGWFSFFGSYFLKKLKRRFT